jgi:hypothetical protein
MLGRTIALFTCMILCWISAPSQSAELSCAVLYGGGGFRNPGFRVRDLWPSGKTPAAYVTCFGGFLSGQISKGDYEKVAAFLKAHYPFMDTFRLNSPGGDVDEAIKIGRLFRKYLISTIAPIKLDDIASLKAGFGVDNWGNIPSLQSSLPGARVLCRGQDCTCASACALIWFGGVDRTGMVGLHRPRIDGPEFKGLPPADASTAYRRVLDRISAYLDEMEVPKPIIESMVATSSGDIRWVDFFDDGLDTPPQHL